MWWFPRSPDLPPVLFFLSGYLEESLGMTLVISEIDLVAQITISAVMIHETGGIFEYVYQSMSRWFRECIHTNGCKFEHILWCFYIMLFIYLFIV